jgi:SsrA-binding protein
MAKSQKKRDIPAGATAVATNRAARRDYDILDTLEVGIQLHGSEVKSLRESKVQLGEAYAIFYQNEMWLVGLHISAYSHSAAAFAHDTDRRRKLLARRSQIDAWASRVDREKLAVIPLAIYFKDSLAKLDMALARGRTQADRRQDIAKRDAEREADRAMSRARSGKY